MSDVLAELLEARVVVIFRRLRPDRVLAAAAEMYGAGLRAYEVTLDSPDALRVIEGLRASLPADAQVGAGTVTSVDEVRQAQEAGARYIISPDLDADVVAATKDRQLVSIPGAFTATEVIRARKLGADVVKLFPAMPVGAGYVRQLRGPAPDVPLLASGGVHVGVARDFFDAGCDVVGVGHTLFGPSAVDDADWKTVAEHADRFLESSGRGAPVGPQ